MLNFTRFQYQYWKRIKIKISIGNHCLIEFSIASRIDSKLDFHSGIIIDNKNVYDSE